MLKYTLLFYIKSQESQRNLNGLWNTGVKLFNQGQTCGSDVRKPSLGTGALLKTEAAANVMKAFGNSRQYMQRRRSHCLRPEKCLHLTMFSWGNHTVHSLCHMAISLWNSNGKLTTKYLVGGEGWHMTPCPKTSSISKSRTALETSAIVSFS